MSEVQRYTIRGLEIDVTAASFGPRMFKPVEEDPNGPWVDAADALEVIKDLEAQLAGARIAILKEELEVERLNGVLGNAEWWLHNRMMNGARAARFFELCNILDSKKKG